MNILKKFIPLILSAGLFFYEIYYTAPPQNWYSASLSQIFLFFIPLIVLITSLAFLFLNFYRSLIVGLAIFVLVVLESTYFLNIYTLLIVAIFGILGLIIFKNSPITQNPSNITKSLTSDPEIPKLNQFPNRRRRRRRRR